ncbi:RNA polymerase sigma factor [Rothia nasisuis]|uniref:RNA polymerase sigma factor n=3 Tax=Rothia nasisuis TaxID=2109647 RepID=UPI001EFF7962|nr:sigma-70 family RNA polymerase sigma factor [Rothia nasisuis]
MQPHNTAQTAPSGPTDELLLSDVREGKLDSFGVLYERYVSMARAVAYKHTTNATLSEDIVSEAFVRVLQALKNGKGPRSFMGGYLTTTISHLAAENGLIAQREIPSEEEHLESMGSLDEMVLNLHESDELISAFTALPERWQTVLWMTEVENKKPREVAQTMNLSANAVSALATRARESLREGFLRAHQNAPRTTECAQYTPYLSSMVRGSLTKKRSEALRTHLSVCSYCTAEYLTLAGINKSMRVWVFPVLAGLTPVITDGAKVLLPFLAGGVTAGSVAGGAGAQGGGIFSGGLVGTRGPSNGQALVGAAAVITAIGAVAGGLALVNNTYSDSPIISADSQLQQPKPQPNEQATGVVDALVNQPQSVASGMPVESLRSAFASDGAPARQKSGPGAGTPTDTEATESQPNSQGRTGDVAGIFALAAPEPGALDESGGAGTLQLPDGGLAPSYDSASPSPAPDQGQAELPTAPAYPVESEEEVDPGGVIQPTTPVTPVEPANPDQPATPVTPVEPVNPDTPVEPVNPDTPDEPDTPVEPVTPDTPDEPDTPVTPVEPLTPVEPIIPDTPEEDIPADPAQPADPLAWVGTEEYFRWFETVPWDVVGQPIEGNKACTITYMEQGTPATFSTYIPEMILDSPYAVYVLESFFEIPDIQQVTCL